MISSSDKLRLRAVGLTVIGAALIAAAVAALVLFPARAVASLPEGFAQSRVATGLVKPTTMALAPDGRVFVAQQGGSLRVIKDGRLLSRPFVKVNTDSRGERGLLGVALDPGFSKNHYVYVYYTAKTPTIHNRVSRFTARGDVAAPGSQRVILELNKLSTAQNHNGGALHFGRDGKLYVAVGDNADRANAQSLRNLKGKMLRINKNGTIPKDNPFYDRASGNNRAIWALGLRNPYSFAVQPGTGRIFINDVGAETWEEINRGAKGANYGWPVHEGPESAPRYVAPIFAYRHGNSARRGCAITGGAFYNPQTFRFPRRYVGDYFFADFCSGWIRSYDVAADRATGFATRISNPVDLKVSRGGTLYYLERGTGSVKMIRYVGN